LIGRAWAGKNEVSTVEVSTDDGITWEPARLNAAGSRDLGRFAWKRVEFDWTVTTPGEYVICVRATDSDGNTQPENAEFNVRGFANNSIQRVPITIVDKIQDGTSWSPKNPWMKRLPVTEAKL
jgi:hypothetical protein